MHRVRAILRKAGVKADTLVPLAGGDVSEVWRAGDYVVKTHASPPPGMFLAEAKGLRQLAAAGALVPRVFWVGEEGIVLEYLPPGPEDYEALAVMLAGLHQKRQKAEYGGEPPLYLGTFPLPGGYGEDWGEFFLEKRIRPLLEATKPLLGGLYEEIPAALRRAPLPAEGPVLIHGDLWRGNVYMSEKGPALIDPSAWVGERGVDLAMMRLFGGFPSRFWQAYEELLPIPPEVEAALPCYQLYFLLVHVKFFGAGYLSSLRRALGACPR